MVYKSLYVIMMKRFQFLIIGLFLSVCIPFIALGKEVIVDGIQYEINEKEKTAELSCIIDKKIKEIKIPDTISIDNSYYIVNSIGYNGFGGCYYLTSVVLPNSIVELKQSAFSLCESLSSIELPKYVKKIGAFAFSSCFNIKSIEIPNSVDYIGSQAFYNCKQLETVILPDSIKTINFGLFLHCENLKSIRIPESVTKIESRVFGGCTNITSIILPDSIRIINDEVFLHCENLKSIRIPESVIEIGHRAFCGCNSIKSITIPKSVINIKSEAFLSCENLQSVSIPNSIITIEDGVFSGCLSLNSIEIPNSVTKICGWAFRDCVKLKNVNIPSSVESIGSYAFSGCKGLQSINISNSVKNIYSNAFSNCRQLLDVYCFADSLPEINVYAFDESYLEYSTLYVPKHSITKYQTTETWNSFGTYRTLEDGLSVELKQCSKPNITYSDSKLFYDCDNDINEYYYKITSSDDTDGFVLASENNVKLNAYYDIICYAIASGYKQSETATAKLYWLPSSGSLEGDNINNVSMRGIAIQSAGGFINISGLDNNEKVDFYGVDGKALGTATSINGTTSFSAQSGTIVVAKIGKESIKISVK